MKENGLNGELKIEQKKGKIIMLKNEFFKSMELHKILKERIRGRIFVTFDGSILNININPGKGIIYTRVINDISNRVNVQDLANEIEFDYRRFILKKYFI